MSTQPPPPASTVPSVLLPELLGFVPQFLLDDIVDTANDAVKQAVDAMEQFLERWATARREKNEDWDSTQEIEQGLVAFQTLLNTHVDIAFDFFETWSLRNIFAVPPDLPLVAPHQEGLKMDWTAEEEEGLEREIKELRRKIHAVCVVPFLLLRFRTLRLMTFSSLTNFYIIPNISTFSDPYVQQRKLARLLTLSARISSLRRTNAERRLATLTSFLHTPHLQTLLSLPNDFLAMYDTVTSLPPSSGPEAASEQQELNAGMALQMMQEPGKRMWETSKTGYVNWAVGQLVARTRAREREDAEGRRGGGVNGAASSGTGGDGVMASVAVGTVSVGTAEDVRATMMALAGTDGSKSRSEQQERSMEVG
jgi:kinetochore protein Mis12/MTW1